MNWQIQLVFFFLHILADESMQMLCINMLPLLPSHFIFFSLIKKDISYVTSPHSYQHTCEWMCTHTHAHTCTRSHTQRSREEPLHRQTHTTIQYLNALYEMRMKVAMHYRQANTKTVIAIPSILVCSFAVLGFNWIHLWHTYWQVKAT